MNNKILLKNTALFLFPLLIPLFILGSFAIVITDKYMKESITSNTINVLQQLEQQTNATLNDMYLLNLDYNWNPDIILSLQNIFDSDYLTFEQNRNILNGEGAIRRREIATPAIHSIYVYYQNKHNRVLTSRSGVIGFDKMYDQAWYDEYDTTSTKEGIWIKNRKMSQFSFEDPEEVITVFKNVFKTNAKTSQGLIVLNLYQSYFENLINELNNYHNQSVFVLDEHNNKLYGNANSNQLDLDNIPLEREEETFEIQIDGTKYIVNQLPSQEYRLRYYSIVEKNIIYLIPNQLRILTIVFVLISLVLGIAIIYYLTRKNTQHVSDIISLLNSSKQDEGELTKNISFKDNEYQYIVRRILKNYVDQNNLEKELNDKKYQLQTAELLALQNQINPHFLSNTLAIIYWRAMALTGKPNKVTQMLETLTDILNFSLRIKNHTVTLEEEINNTMNYLSILRIRSDKDFNIIWDYYEKDLHLQVLKFVLQPLIENSIQHGMHYENSEEKLTIKVRIKTKNEKVIISVTDNGKGMDQEKLENLLTQLDKDEYVTNHIGLANIKKRLSLIYNYDYRFKIRSKENYGTTILIEHPLS
ncbi:sensor histidine kinase [Gracilibacillus sp. YIM 98692]|uniref:sensor histidine kinase n=1 Tax=Gracilibacillus sp. YIM 98692 TaxID=2663532 RepID=UPI0013D75D8B|nr:sensor histidine kinase [Gracilibacillus sp. YIM 98692]